MTEKKTNPKQSKLFAIIIAVVVIGFFGYSFLTDNVSTLRTPTARMITPWPPSPMKTSSSRTWAR